MTPATPAKPETVGKYGPARLQAKNRPADVAGAALKPLASKVSNTCRQFRPLRLQRPSYREAFAGVAQASVCRRESEGNWTRAEGERSGAIPHAPYTRNVGR